MSDFRMMLLPFVNDVNSSKEKALRGQGLPAQPTTPPKALDEVVGNYQSFSEVAIGCLEFVGHELMRPSLRVAETKRYCTGLRGSINGRDGHAECFLTNEQQIDDLIGRLVKLKIEAFKKNEVDV